MSDGASKQALRQRCSRSRQERAPSSGAAAEAIAAHLPPPPFAQVDRVACYLSMGTEPGTGPLITGLLTRGIEVIVPVTGRRPGSTGSSTTRPRPCVSALGVPEPDGPRLGADALADAGLVIVPALAVDHAG